MEMDRRSVLVLLVLAVTWIDVITAADVGPFYSISLADNATFVMGLSSIVRTDGGAVVRMVQ